MAEKLIDKVMYCFYTFADLLCHGLKLLEFEQCECMFSAENSCFEANLSYSIFMLSHLCYNIRPGR